MLLVDCSQHASFLGLVLADGATPPTVLDRRFEPEPHAKEERFWNELRALLDSSGLPGPEAIRSVAVAVGPGGFTGLRVSIAFAKAVAISRGIPLIPVPSAALFAASDIERNEPGPRLVALAAKAGTAWVTLVRDPVREGAEGELIKIAHLPEHVGARCPDGAVMIADGFVAADGVLDLMIATRLGGRFARRSPEIDANAFAALSLAIFATERAVGAAGLLPIYAREPEAVTNWRARAAPRAS